MTYGGHIYQWAMAKLSKGLLDSLHAVNVSELGKQTDIVCEFGPHYMSHTSGLGLN